MAIFSSIISRFITLHKSQQSDLKAQENISISGLSRLYGPFDIDYSKIRAKGTLQ